jgi:hypothetical protein
LELTDEVLNIQSVERLQKVLEICIGYTDSNKLAIIECENDRVVKLPVKLVHSTTLPAVNVGGWRELEHVISFEKGQVRGNVLVKDLDLEGLKDTFADFKDSKHYKGTLWQK